MKNTALKFINPILALFVLLTFISMVLYKFGPAAWRGSETLAQLHTFGGALFFFTACLHVFYNWSWIKANLLGKKGKHKA